MNKELFESNFVIYKTEDGSVSVDVILKDETIWITQKGMAELFECSSDNIGLHLKNIYSDEELLKETTTEKYSVVRKEGNRQVKRTLEFYNLDAIIAVGYRVNSKKATQFRMWATKTLKEYMIKGFVIDKEKMKNGPKFGKDYFDDLLEIIKEIRLSERRQYQKITDIYSTSVDYDKDSETTKDFFKTVQNKLHYAVTGNTAAEIIYNRANSEKEHMGLTNWKESPDGPIYRYDVDIAKNYLNKKELKDLNRIVTMYLDYAEYQAENHNAMTMNDWVERLNAFLQFNGKEILKNAGKISGKVAQELAHKEYDKYRLKQDKLYVSDFDKFIEKVKLIENKDKK